jgi:hypothetical protein
VGTLLVRLLGGTLRWELFDEAGYAQGLPKGQPLLVGTWHNRILILPLCYEWLCRGRRPLTVLTSASRDGALLARFVAAFGIGAVRGSSSRGGMAAVRELRKLLKAGRDVVITPDGPRGPAYQINPGLLFLAAKTGIPLMPIRVEYDKFWELRSWDKFRIPKPFSRVRVWMLPPVHIPDGDLAVIEDSKALLEELLGKEPHRPEEGTKGRVS